MGKGQLHPFVVMKWQERRNMSRCKKHAEGYKKKNIALDSI